MNQSINLKQLLQPLLENAAITLAVKIDDAIESTDENMSIETFAQAVASIVSNNYGNHNYATFLKVLHNELNSSKTRD